MSDVVQGWAFAMVRGWTRLYTAGARHEARDARRAQVQSDLWEHRAEAKAEGIATSATSREVASRMVRSIPADVAWRLDTGGVEVPPMFWVERGAGVFLLLVVVLFAGASGGPGISGSDPYFTNDFPTFADNGRSVARAIAFRFAVGLATVVTAVLLFQTFRRESPRIAGIAALALVVGGAMFIGSAVATLELHGLAEDWQLEGRVAGGATWDQAQQQAGRQESMGFLGILSLGVAFAGFGVIIARSSILPRALAWPALAGGTLVIGSVPLWSVGDWAWYVAMLGTMSLGVSFLLTAGWLALRGTRPAAPA